MLENEHEVGTFAGKRPQRGEGRSKRNRIHPRNWGYSNHLDRVFSLRCFQDLVRLRVFPDAKDISESFGALQAALRDGVGDGTSASAKAAEKLDHVLCLSVGDGATARTATLAAFLTGWHAVSVDPLLRPDWCGDGPHGVQRLSGFAAKFEDFMADAAALAGIAAAVGTPRAGGAADGGGGGGGESDDDAVLERRIDSAAAEAPGAHSSPAAGSAAQCSNKRAKKGAAAADHDQAGVLLAFAKTHRAEWVGWLRGPASSPHAEGGVEVDGVADVIMGHRGTPMTDPRLYPPPALARFRAHVQGFTAEAGSNAQDSAVEPPDGTSGGGSGSSSGSSSSSGCGGGSGGGGVKQLVILAVHAHFNFRGPAAIESVRRSFGYPPTCVVFLPCCHRYNPTLDLGRAP